MVLLAGVRSILLPYLMGHHRFARKMTFQAVELQRYWEQSKLIPGSASKRLGVKQGA